VSKRQKFMITKKTNLLVAALSLVLLVSCSSEEAPAPGAGEIKPYQVLEISEQNTTIETSYPAILEGIENVDIHPKIDGFVEKIAVDEGQFVKKGQLLFTISAPQYEQLVRTAR